jgi:hypothetical protein
MYEVRNDETTRTIYVRMSGLLREEEMSAWAQEYRRVTDAYEGGRHLVLADMRGMLASSEAVAEMMRDAIAYARKRGVTCCAHLSDSAIQRLQAARIAREASEGDDVTVNVVSLEEANRVLDEARRRLP